MRERGLALSPMMARATVRAEAPKTMTRRLVNPQPWAQPEPTDDGRWQLFAGDEGSDPFLCPYGVPGDRLWGREAWRTLSKYDSLPPRDVPTTAPIWYEADGKAPPEFGRYRHGRFMVRWMARIVREVTSVAVERLSSISELDALREGIEIANDVIVGCYYANVHHEVVETRFFIPGLDDEGSETPSPVEGEDPMPGFDTAQDAFFRLWEILHGPGSCEADPWLWVIGYGEVRQ